MSDDINDRIAQLEREVAANKARREKAEAEASEAQIVAALKEALTAAGVPTQRARVAISMIHHQDRRAVIDDRGQVMWAKYGPGETDRAIDLDEGVRGWLNTEDGADFKAPPSKPNRTRTTAGGEADVDEIVHLWLRGST